MEVTGVLRLALVLVGRHRVALGATGRLRL